MLSIYLSRVIIVLVPDVVVVVLGFFVVLFWDEICKCALKENTSNKGATPSKGASAHVCEKDRERESGSCVCVCVVLFYCVLYSILLISPTSIPAQSATAAAQPNSLPAISTWPR